MKSYQLDSVCIAHVHLRQEYCLYIGFARVGPLRLFQSRRYQDLAIFAVLALCLYLEG